MSRCEGPEVTGIADRNLMLKRGERVAGSSTIITLLLGLLKGLVGALSGSVALIADAVHSFSDVFASLAVFIGLRLAQKKPTERFPYGYYRAETLASLIVSIVIILSGIDILRESFGKVLAPTSISSPVSVLLVAFLSATLSYVLAMYKGKVGREIGSQALIGDGQHSRIDVYLSSTVLVGVFSSYIGSLWVEPLAGLIISLVVIGTGLSLGKDAALVLMDASLKPAHLEQMKRVALDVPGVMGVHGVKVRRSGPFVLGEMRIEVEKDVPAEKAHRVSQTVEQKLKEAVKGLDSLTIHVEPVTKEKLRVAIPISDRGDLFSRPAKHFGKAPYFMLVDIKDGKIEDWAMVENPSARLVRKRGITAANFLLEQKVGALLVGELGEGPFHVLRGSLVQVYRLPGAASIEEAIRALMGQGLEAMMEPTKG